MSIAGVIKGYWYPVARKRTLNRLRRTPPGISLERSNWDYSLQHPTEFYLECVRHFQQSLAPELKEHRAYFFEGHRGFGEDAFHVMWDMLLREFKPASFLEIGVFRGQVVSLVALWSRLNQLNCGVWGISPFSGAGDSTSSYRRDMDYYQDTLANFDHFKLPHPTLLRASSTDPEAVKLITSRAWDLIYIDGNHDYDIVLKDWAVCSRSVKKGGVIVLDDANMTPAYQPPACLATRGLPGPSQLAAEINRAEFREILQVGHNRAFQKLS